MAGKGVTMGDMELEFTKQELAKYKAEAESYQYKYHNALSQQQRLQELLMTIVSEALEIPPIQDRIAEIVAERLTWKQIHDALKNTVEEQIREEVKRQMMKYEMEHIKLQ